MKSKELIRDKKVVSLTCPPIVGYILEYSTTAGKSDRFPKNNNVRIERPGADHIARRV